MPLSHPLKVLNKIQRQAVIWILGVFHTSTTLGIETIAGPIPIQLYLQNITNFIQLVSLQPVD